MLVCTRSALFFSLRNISIRCAPGHSQNLGSRFRRTSTPIHREWNSEGCCRQLNLIREIVQSYPIAISRYHLTSIYLDLLSTFDLVIRPAMMLRTCWLKEIECPRTSERRSLKEHAPLISFWMTWLSHISLMERNIREPLRRNKSPNRYVCKAGVGVHLTRCRKLKE